MIETMKRLINIGLPLIPICHHEHAHATPKHLQLCKCAGKTPLIKNWTVRNSTTLEDLAEWIHQFKRFNIGVPLGDASGYVGIDVDGEQGEQFLQEMSQGNIPETWEFSTGAGRRLLYLIPPGTKTKKFKQAAKDGGHQECAILCTGQQTVLPPSIHYTGRLYEWNEGKSPWDIDCAESPKWLVDLIRIDESAKPTGGFTLNLDNGTSTPIDILDDLEGEFSQEDFDASVPDNVVNNQAVVKTQKGKSGHQIVVTDEMLTQPIPEGQRDNVMTAIIGHYCANRDFRLLGKDFLMSTCLYHNNRYCQPPLEHAEIEVKVNYFYNMEIMKDSKYKEMKKDKPQFEASKMAAVVRNKLEEDNLLIHFDQSSKMYYYTTRDQGPWHCTRNTTLISKWIRAVITNPIYGHPTWDKQSYIEEVRRALEEIFTEAFKEFDDFDLGAHADDLSKYIVLNNGMLDWKTKQVLPWDPTYYTTVSFNVDYDPTAVCPKFEEYMAQWLPDVQTRAVVQEYLGYCLIPNTKFRKALFLYGKGKNGKSMLLEFMQQFFKEHMSTLSYDGLFQRFGTANLKGKLVNIFDDTTVSFVKDTGTAKNLIAGGTISAEFKGKDHFTFTNVARFIFSAQETPKTSDHTEAWYDRWAFIKFPNKFKPSSNMKTQIHQDMKEEYNGIFNWMVEGLKRLMEQDAFTAAPELDACNDEYRNQNDSIAMFVSNMCLTDKNSDGASLHTLYKIYCAWSSTEGMRTLSKRTFSERLEDLGYKKKKGYLEGKSGQTFIVNLIINKECEDYQENKLEYTLALQNM